MALQFSPQHNAVCGRKRKHQEKSVFSDIDWLDQVVADVSTTKPCHEPGAAVAPPIDKKVKVEPCLQEFFTNMLRSRGYPASTHSSLSCGYNNKPTVRSWLCSTGAWPSAAVSNLVDVSSQQHQISSYGIAFTNAVRSANHQKVKHFLFTHHLNPNACNKFGESVVHVVCRRGNHSILALLLEAGCSVQICDDFGRTPLHDACWTSQPNFELISMLLDKDPWLLSLKDQRGTTPLGYVKYDSHCRLWIEYLKEVADKYWPCINSDAVDGSLDLKPSSVPRTPPLAELEPNSRPIPNPKSRSSSSLEILELIANGMDPEDDSKSQPQKACGIIRRITHEPTKVKGLFSAPSWKREMHHFN